MKRYSALIFLACLAVVLLVSFFSKVEAVSINTQVTVGNTVPSFSVDALESPASDASNPTNINANVTFVATATDMNTDQYYLLICKTNSAPTANVLSAPACNGGASNQLCVSSATNSGVQANCSHNTAGEVALTQVWYAFVCDRSSLSDCSAVGTQGATAADSPYHVNHAPTFSSVISTPTMNPGGSATFTVPAVSWTDTDGDQGKLLVCSTASITNGACSATTLCSSALTSTGSALSCTYSDGGNPVRQSATYNAYTFVVDSHNFAATGVGQGANVGYTINNMAPVVSSVIVNGVSAITLNPNATKSINITATVSDNNSCQDLGATAVAGKLYRSAIGAGACSATNSTNCYIIVATNCTQAGADSCSGATDATVSYSCSVALQYFTDPTDGLSAATNTYFAEDWKSTITATDVHSASGSAESVAGVEVNSLNSVILASSINYGGLAPGVTSGGGLINTPLTITNVGNVGINAEAQGGGSGLCKDSYPACATAVIPLANQKWEFVNNSTAWTSGTNILDSNFATLSLGIHKPSSTSAVTGNIYWGLAMPEGQAYGAYYGSTIINSLTSAPGSW